MFMLGIFYLPYIHHNKSNLICMSRLPTNSTKQAKLSDIYFTRNLYATRYNKHKKSFTCMQHFK